MNIKGFITIVSISLLFLSSCESNDEEPTPSRTNDAQLRIENVSPFDFEKIIVEAGGGGTQIYDALSAGGTSDYKGFDYIYRYGFIQVLIADDTLSLQPIDYVGEERYFNGQYTYLIDIITESEQPAYMILEFKQD